MTVMPASVTPFDANGRVDLPGVARLLAHFRASGCDGVVLAGTNGEGPSLSAVEKRDLVRAAVPLAPGLSIVLGIATPSLDEAIWLSQQAAKAGASAGLVMPPAYFREASEEGLAAWFEALLDASPLPLLFYNLPQRTGIRLTPELLARLNRHEHALGLKDSSGEAGNLAPYAQAMPGKRLFVGDETLLMEALAAGWTGTISGAANVVPNWLAEILRDEGESRATKFAYLLPALQALRGKGQPALNKALLHELGIVERPDLRLPLLPLDPAVVQEVKQELAGYVKFP